MKIQVFSDIHLDFHRDGGKAFLESLDPDGCDALLFAGDICPAVQLPEILGYLSRKYPMVFFVLGNHEYFGQTPQMTHKLAKRAEQPNVVWLDQNTATYQEQRFLGCTLWYPETPKAPKKWMPDFSHIEDFEPWVYRKHAASVEWLERTLLPSDVVITHQAPSPRSTSPGYEEHPLDPFFIVNLERLIQSKQPKLWVHGHVHSQHDYFLDKSHIVCNPLGYPTEQVNGVFRPKVVEL